MKSFIHPTAVIHPNVKIGKNVHIGAFCIIGDKPESINHWNNANKYTVEIGDNTIITGHVTIDAGTIKNTIIRDKCFIMKGCHIGHDAEIDSGVIMSPHVVIGGHSFVGMCTNIGIGAVVHQRVNIPGDCMIGMNSTVTKKSALRMQPNEVVIGSPAKFIRWNNRKK